MPEVTQYCSFRLGAASYGVEVEKVRETLRGMDVTPVPLAPPSVRGIVNLRGEIVTAIDLRLRLKCVEAAIDDTPGSHVIV
ncbi:MAG: chemotaxis protein CheW, partial [Planctomycetota bacterium]